MVRKLIYLLSLIFLSISCSKHSENKIDLSGIWQFKIDSLDVGKGEKWFNKNFDDTIILPGSMTENGKGNDVSIHTKWTGQIVDSAWYTDKKYDLYRKPGNLKIPFWLQPTKHYVGPAWYKRIISIPESWKEKRIKLVLERCHWLTRVWIDGNEIGEGKYLATPHEFDLPNNLTPGDHSLVIRIDNRISEINPGINAHSISDHTQTNWNGIVGKILLTVSSPVYFKNVKLFPDVSTNNLRVKLELNNDTGKEQQCTLTLSATNLTHNPDKLVKQITLNEGKEIEIDYSMGNGSLLWDEFNPNLYKMNIVLESPIGKYSESIAFGMREFTVKDTRFLINDRQVFLRGTLECAIFPKTGYPSTEVSEWERIFTIIKDHGLNHMRFHSWCPPEAAFTAADKIGIYLQVEASAWASIGNGKPIDKWLYQEAENILDTYGNHPSFCLMAYGNEPAGPNQVEFLDKFITHLKNIDPQKVYTAAAGWPFVKSMDYYNTYEPRIQRWGEGLNSIINSKPPQTLFDYRDIISSNYNDKPVISHEIGQWCVYPNLKEIKKYTGILKAKNFEIFQETLSKNHMGDLSEDFLMSSGKLQALCYKADIEAALRTPGMAGFQLLDLHDFPGQGTALVGVLDAFWDEKGYVSPQSFKNFCNTTVPLARFSKRIFLNNESAVILAEAAHFGESEIRKVIPTWQVNDESGKVVFEGKFAIQNIPINNETKIGKIHIDVSNIRTVQKLTLKIKILNYENTWDFWVYPAQNDKIEGVQIHETSTIDDETMNVLEEGGNVLLNIKHGSLKDEKGGTIQVGFSSIFWNTAWTKSQSPHSLGILCDPDHPLFQEFPTEFHTNWQWWDIISNSHAIILDKFSHELKPLVRIIDDWFKDRRLGLLIEAKVGNGNMMISGIDFREDIDKKIAARQLLFSIKKYMSSNSFDPEIRLNVKEIKSLLKE